MSTDCKAVRASSHAEPGSTEAPDTGSASEVGRARAGPLPKELLSALRTMEARCPFGPTFFLSQLRGFVRDRCPEPTEVRPIVDIHLLGGEVFQVCHVTGLAPGWVALAVHDDPGGAGHAMRTEIVPYAAIVRVTIRAGPSDGLPIGFSQERSPAIVRPAPPGDTTAEELLQAAAMGWEV